MDASDPGATGKGDVDGGVGAAGVDHDDVVAPVPGVQARWKVGFLVQRQDENRDFHISPKFWPGSKDSRRVTVNNRPRRDVACRDGPGADDGIGADGHARNLQRRRRRSMPRLQRRSAT